MTSPLDWAVIVGAKSDVQSIADLRGKTIGISRIGSGSQVMASYMALKHGWTDAQGQVEPIKFEGARLPRKDFRLRCSCQAADPTGIVAQCSTRSR